MILLIQSSLEDLVSLEPFVCMEVNVSLMAVNAYGFTEFSPEAVIQVHESKFCRSKKKKQKQKHTIS